MIFILKGHKNIDKLKQTMSTIIDNFEKQLSDFSPSCKDILIENSLPILNQSISEAAKWEKNHDYTNMAYAVLYNIGFGLLASGRFHISYGVLNPMNESQHIYKFCIYHLNRACSLGFISEFEKDDQIAYLNECISEIG